MIDSFRFTAEKKYGELKGILQRYNSIAVAFSGGVDSTLLLWAAIESLGLERVTGVYLISELHSQESNTVTVDLIDKCFPSQLDFRTIQVRPLEWPDFVKNSPDRCYNCKKKMYSLILNEIAHDDIETLADGTNYDDLAEDRPGFSAIKELGVQTPLAEAHLEKNEIRFLARQFGLVNWNLPSNSCFATRIMDCREINSDLLAQVARAESQLMRLGFAGGRVRLYATHVVIEVAKEDIPKIVDPSIRLQLLDFFARQGVGKVSLGLRGR